MSGPNTAIQYSFATGIISQGIYNRDDWDRRGGGLADALNAIITPTGGATKRPGFRFHSDCLHNDRPVRLIKFEFNESQVYMLEFGNGIMRFHTNDGVILNAANNDYIINTPFTLDQILKARTCQDRDMGVYTHREVPPQQLVRFAHTDWRWSRLFQDVSRIEAPTNLEFFDQYSNGHNGFEYAVTSYRIVNGAVQESLGYQRLQSAPVSYVPPISQAPANNSAEQCIAWIKTYRGSYGHMAGFPTYPESMDLSDVYEDFQEPRATGGFYQSCNQKIHDIYAGYYGSLDVARRTFKQYTGNEGQEQDYYMVVEVGGVEVESHKYWHIKFGGTDSSYSLDPYKSLTSGPQSTWILLTNARNYLAANVPVNGVRPSDVYNNIMAFIDYVNNVNTIKINNRIKWRAPAGAVGYYIYRRPINSSDPNFYRIGTAPAAQTNFEDPNVEETVVQPYTPPTGQSEFINSSDWPAVCEFFQQRLMLANTSNKPASIFASRSGIYTDFTVNPSDPSAGYEFQMSSGYGQLNEIKDIVSLKTLSLLTSGGDFVSTVSGAIHAGNVNFNQHSYNGTSDVPAEVIGDSAMYVPLAQLTIQSMVYSFEKDGFARDNILFHCQELAEDRRVVDIAFQREPINLIWALLDDGTLMSCKYIPEQNFQAWTRHETQGEVVSIATMQDGNNVDRLWAVIRRTLGNGSVRQYIEILDDTRPYGGVPNAMNSFYVDCGMTAVFNNPSQIVYGLDELEGLEVVVLADNDVMPPRIVTNGQIELDYPARIIHVGLPYEFKLKTLDLELLNQGTLRNAPRQITQAQVEVYRTRELLYSVNGGKERARQPQKGETLGLELEPFTGDVQVNSLPKEMRHSYLTLRSTRPVPCTVKSIVAEISTGVA